MIPERAFIDQAADLVERLIADGYSDSEIVQISDAMMYLATLRDMPGMADRIKEKKAVS